MPLPREKWLLGRKVSKIHRSQVYIELLSIILRYSDIRWFALAGKIEDFFKRNSNLAFTYEEIKSRLVSDALSDEKRAVTSILLDYILEQLLTEGVIEAREVEENGIKKVYYAIKEE